MKAPDASAELGRAVGDWLAGANAAEWRDGRRFTATLSDGTEFEIQLRVSNNTAKNDAYAQAMRGRTAAVSGTRTKTAEERADELVQQAANANAKQTVRRL